MTINDRPTAADLRHVIRALHKAYREATDPAEKELARIPVHVVNRCKFAALTFGNVRAAREYEQRTGRHASACGSCGKWHA